MVPSLNKILDILIQNPNIMLEELGKKAGMSKNGIQSYLSRLQKSTFILKAPFTTIYSLKHNFADEIGFESNFSNAIEHYKIPFLNKEDNMKYRSDMIRDTYIPLLSKENGIFNYTELSNENIYLSAVFSSQVEHGSRGSVVAEQKITFYFSEENFTQIVSNIAEKGFKISNSIYEDRRTKDITFTFKIISHLVQYYVSSVLNLTSNTGFINMDLYRSLSIDQKRHYIAGILDCHLNIFHGRDGNMTDDNEIKIHKIKEIMLDYFGIENRIVQSTSKRISYNLIFNPKQIDKIFSDPILNYIKNIRLLTSYENAEHTRKNPDFEKLNYDNSLKQLKIVLRTAHITKKLHLQLHYNNIDILTIILVILAKQSIDAIILPGKRSQFIFLRQKAVFQLRNLKLFPNELENQFQEVLKERRNSGIKDSTIMKEYNL